VGGGGEEGEEKEFLHIFLYCDIFEKEKVGVLLISSLEDKRKRTEFLARRGKETVSFLPILLVLKGERQPLYGGKKGKGWRFFFCEVKKEKRKSKSRSFAGLEREGGEALSYM